MSTRPRVAVLVFPGSNDDRDAAWALGALGAEARLVWHAEAELPTGTGAVVLPGGFSYGDYLRCGAIARFAPILDAVRDFAAGGGPVLGICNGFQILCEAGLLPGVLRRNRDLEFVCRDVRLTVERTDTLFTARCEPGQVLTIPVKHGEGSWYADEGLLAELEESGQVLLRYAEDCNGSVGDVAGVCNPERNVFGLMPHPEHAVDPLHGQFDVAADELEVAVPAQDAGQEPRLAEDLEAVADPEHRAAVGGEAPDGIHHRRDAGDRPATEVVAVGEPARKHDAARSSRERRVAVPHRRRLGAEPLEREPGVTVVVRAGKGDDRDARPFAAHASSTTTSKLSMSGLASSSAHMRSTSARADSASSAATSRSTRRPTRARVTEKPSVESDAWTASPCGSRIPAFGRMRTVSRRARPPGRRRSGRTRSR